MPLAGFFLCSMVTLAHALPEQRVHRPQSAAGACGPCLFRGRFVHQAGDHIQHLAIVLHPGPAGVPAVACAVDFLAIVQLAADRGVPSVVLGSVLRFTYSLGEIQSSQFWKMMILPLTVLTRLGSAGCTAGR